MIAHIAELPSGLRRRRDDPPESDLSIQLSVHADGMDRRGTEGSSRTPFWREIASVFRQPGQCVRMNTISLSVNFPAKV